MYNVIRYMIILVHSNNVLLFKILGPKVDFKLTLIVYIYMSVYVKYISF